MSTIEDKSTIFPLTINVGDCYRRKDNHTIIDRFRRSTDRWLAIHQEGYIGDVYWDDREGGLIERRIESGELIKCPDAPRSWPVIGEQAINPASLKELYQSVRSALADASIGRAALSPSLLSLMNSALDSAHIPQDPPHD